MKIITLTKEKFDTFSSKHKYNSFYQSVDYANFSQSYNHYDIHYLGFTDDNGTLIGASLMLYKNLFLGYKLAYAPRGILIDYDNTDLITEMTIALRKLLKKQKFIFITIDPPVVASERDKNGNTIQFNENVNNILNCFKKNGYEHLGFNLYNESVLPRWNVLAPLNKDEKVLFNSFDSNIKEKLIYADSIAVNVKIDKELNIDKFYETIKKSSNKKGIRYFQNIAKAFANDDKIKIFNALLDTKKYTANASKLYEKEEEKNKNLAQIIQSGDRVKYNIAKAINDKVTSDKLLHNYKKDVVDGAKLLKANPDGIILGCALVIEDSKGANILVNYANTNYERYNVTSVLTYEIMQYYGKKNYSYINLGPVTGNFSSTSKYYELLTSKLGFNSSILEYIGQFDIILNPIMYKIYKKKYKKKIMKKS